MKRRLLIALILLTLVLPLAGVARAQNTRPIQSDCCALVYSTGRWLGWAASLLRVTRIRTRPDRFDRIILDCLSYVNPNVQRSNQQCSQRLPAWPGWRNMQQWINIQIRELQTPSTSIKSHHTRRNQVWRNIEHYYRVKAEFDENNKLPSDAKYIHFFGTVTSQQKGGGTSKIKLVPQYSGYEKSIELFDPDIKTNPGPIDVYVYTNPSVIEVDQMKNFDVVINFYNGGKDGTASIKNVILYQTFANLDELPFEINCEETKGTAEPVECPDNKKGNCWQITFNEDSQLNIPPKESRQIYCDAIVNNEFALIHELTVPISVVSEYTYIQEFGTTRKVQSS